VKSNNVISRLFGNNLVQHKLLLSIIPIILSIGILSTVNYDTLDFSANSVPKEHVKIMEGHLQVILTDKNGEVKQIVDKKNMIVGEGLETVLDLLFDDINLNGNATDSKFDTIKIGDGNTAPTANDYDLQTPISGCVAIEDPTITGGGTNSTTWAYTSVQFSGATCTSATVSEAILINDLTSYEVLARQTFTDINVGASDTLTVNWNVTMSDDGV